MKEAASVTYSPGSKRWDFSAFSASGYINITTKGFGKKLMKLKETGFNHVCTIEYDTDSKIEALNGNFYSVFKVSACDLWRARRAGAFVFWKTAAGGLPFRDRGARVIASRARS